MLPIFDGVRDVTVLSTTLRMLLAVDQADKASPFGEHIHSTLGSQAM